MEGERELGLKKRPPTKKITKFPEAQERLESSHQLCNWEQLTWSIFRKSCWNFYIQAENSGGCQSNFSLEIFKSRREWNSAARVLWQKKSLWPKYCISIQRLFMHKSNRKAFWEMDEIRKQITNVLFLKI